MPTDTNTSKKQETVSESTSSASQAKREHIVQCAVELTNQQADSPEMASSSGKVSVQSLNRKFGNSSSYELSLFVL